MGKNIQQIKLQILNKKTLMVFLFATSSKYFLVYGAAAHPKNKITLSLYFANLEIVSIVKYSAFGIFAKISSVVIFPFGSLGEP